MKNNTYAKGDGIKAVSKAPDWIIKFIGWRDSHKSTEVSIAHLNKYLAILAENEKDEALLAVEALKNNRKLGSKHLNTILHADTDPSPEPRSSDASPAAQRAYAKSLASHKSKMAAITSAREALVEIDAAISSGNLVFEERLEKTRNKGMSQIEVYIKGVRSGKHHDFNPEIEHDDTARTKYYNTNKENDDLIHKYAQEVLS